jgi:hypothetical protein
MVMTSAANDWSGSRGFYELMRQTEGGAIFSDWWCAQAEDAPQPIQKTYAVGSVEHSKWLRGEGPIAAIRSSIQN